MEYPFAPQLEGIHVGASSSTLGHLYPLSNVVLGVRVCLEDRLSPDWSSPKKYFVQRYKVAL